MQREKMFGIKYELLLKQLSLSQTLMRQILDSNKPYWAPREHWPQKAKDILNESQKLNRSTGER